MTFNTYALVSLFQCFRHCTGGIVFVHRCYEVSCVSVVQILTVLLQDFFIINDHDGLLKHFYY